VGKFLVLALGLLLAFFARRLLAGSAFGDGHDEGEDEETGREKLVRCDSCGAYHPKNERCECGGKGR